MSYCNHLIVIAALTVSLVSPAAATAQNHADKTEPRSQGHAEIREGADTGEGAVTGEGADTGAGADLRLDADTRKNAGAPADEDSKASKNEATDVTRLDAPAAVREGNRLLRADELTPALRAYEHAQSIEPDAREIDFVQGLAHFKDGAYELARQSFEDAATASSETLVDDALYGVGTTYHAEALARQENPQEAFPLLEQAMKRYQEVLAHQPDHQAARDANYRAASKWRVIKKLLEEQQKQRQKQQDDQQQEKNEEQQEQDDQQKQNQDDQQQSQEQQQQDPSQQDEQEQDGDPQDQEQEQEPQASESDQQDDNEQDAKQAQAQQEEVSREDAQRKLRELMQALRDRNEFRPKRAKRYRPAPVDKDW